MESLRDQIDELIGHGDLSRARDLLYTFWLDGKLIPADEHRRGLESVYENAIRADSSEAMRIIRDAAVLLKRDTP